MLTNAKTEFLYNFEIRYDVLISLQLVLLLIFRFLTLFISTKSLHNIEFFTFNELLLIYTVILFIISSLMLIAVPRKVPNQNTFFIAILLNIFVSILYVEQFFIVNNPIVIPQDDITLILLQVVILGILIMISPRRIYNPDNPKFKINDYLLLLVLLSFILLLISKLMTISEQSNFFLIFAVVGFWLFLWICIIRYMNELRLKIRIQAYIPLVFAFMLGIGMFFGMTKSQVMRAVIITIIDQTFSLHVIGNLISLNFNPELLMILINLVTGFAFLLVLGTALISFRKQKDMRDEIVLFLLLGLTGLAVFPVLALFRFFAVFRLTTKKELLY